MTNSRRVTKGGTLGLPAAPRAIRTHLGALVVLVLAAALMLAGVAVPDTEPLEKTKPVAVEEEPDATHAVVVVHVASDRNSVDSGGHIDASPLAGVELRIGQRTGGTGSASNPYTYTPLDLDRYPWARCVSDADGDCVVKVPLAATAGGAAPDDGFAWDAPLYVMQTETTAMPDGYERVLQIGSGTATPVNVTAKNYAMRIGAAPHTPDNPDNAWRLRPDVGTDRDDGMYDGGTDFMTADSSARSGQNPQYNSSAGLWPVARKNPALPTDCGLRVALVLDLSASTAGSGITQLRQSANAFVDALAGTPSSVAVFPFATTGAAGLSANLGTNRGVLPLTSVASPDDPNGAQRVHAKINGLQTEPQGYTNWGQGLSQIVGTGDYDMVIKITDGNPTVYGDGFGANEGVNTMFRDVGAGIFAANRIKADGTPVIAFGVGDGIDSAGSEANLRAITGPNTEEQTNYYHQLSYAEAAEELETLATQNCAGTMTVLKNTVPHGTPADSTVEELNEVATPAGGWDMSAETSTEGVTFDNGEQSQSKTTADGSGAAAFAMNFNTEENADVTVREALKGGYTHFTVGSGEDAQNAVCEGRTAGDPDSEWGPLPVTNVGDGTSDPGFSLDAPPPFMIACTVYNEEPPHEASLEVDKKWVVNNNGEQTTYDHGHQPPELQASLHLEGDTPGPGQGFNTLVPGYTEDDEVTIGEELSVAATGCEVRSRAITSVDGDPVDPVPVGDGYAADLHGGENIYELTNTIDCTTKLALFKQVNGSITPDNWTLSAQPIGDGADDAQPGPSGTQEGSLPTTTGVAADVTSDFAYALREDTAPGADPGVANYEELPPTDPEQAPPEATGRWVCRVLNPDGTFAVDNPDTIGGQNGVIGVSLGQSVGCLATNSTSQLTLKKEVVSEAGGDAEPSDWTLVATPRPGDEELPPGVEEQTVTGSTDGVTIEVHPDVTYDLSEEGGPGDYTHVSTTCQVGTEDPEETSQINVEAQRSAECTFRNAQEDVGTVVQKSVRDSVQNPDGTWTITYDVSVISTAVDSRVLYDLRDTLRFGDGIDIEYGDGDSPRWVENGAEPPREGTWADGETTATLATAHPIAPSSTDTYTVTVNATVTDEAWADDGAAIECPEDDSDDAGGFRNTATVTVAGEEQDAAACAEPATLSIDKTAGTAEQDPDTGEWTIPYTVRVTNASREDQYYDLTDAPEFADGVTIERASASGPEGAIPDWDGVDGTTLADDMLIPAATDDGPGVHTYELSVVASVGDVSETAAQCSAEEGAGHGFFNGADMITGTLDKAADACVDAPAPEPTPTGPTDTSTGPTDTPTEPTDTPTGPTDSPTGSPSPTDGDGSPSASDGGDQPSPSKSAPGDGELPFTGAQVGPLVALAAALVAAGGVLLAVRRMRRRRE